MEYFGQDGMTVKFIFQFDGTIKEPVQIHVNTRDLDWEGLFLDQSK